MRTEPLRGLPYGGVAGMWAGEPEQGERATRHLRELATPLLDMSGPIVYVAYDLHNLFRLNQNIRPAA